MLINLIIPNAYGPNDYLDVERTHAMNGLIIRMLQTKKRDETDFTVWGTGSPIREWIYMKDVGEIIKQIINEEMFSLPNPINIGQEYGITISESVEKIKEILNYPFNIKYDLTKQDGAPIKILGKKIFNQYFPNFKFTTYTEGISNTIKYYENLI
jgi:GDP-L-fucose synthase